jgi:acetyl-CoA carboxylase carboxyl transferase subunit alpha
MAVFLDFEKSIAELEGKIEELRHLANSGDLNIVDEITRLQSKVDKQLKQIYAKLSPWQKVKVARHLERPQFFTYLEALLAGLPGFGENPLLLWEHKKARIRNHAFTIILGCQCQKGTAKPGGSWN